MKAIAPPSLLSFLLLLVLVPSSSNAQEMRVLTPDDYGQFESLGSGTLSSDGAWLAYAIRRVNEQNELRLSALNMDSVRTMPWATSPQFSPDARWLAWRQDLSAEEREALEKKDQPVRTGLGLLNLTTGEQRSFESVAEFTFDASGNYLAVLGYAPDKPERKGGDLRVLDLITGSETSFGSVAEFAWASQQSVLAFIVDTGSDSGNGVQMFDAKTGRVVGLTASGSRYQNLSWRDESFDLAVLKSALLASEEGTAYTVLAWKNLGPIRSNYLELTSATEGISESMEVVEYSPLQWSEDGSSLSIGLRPTETPDDEADSAGNDSTHVSDDIEDENLPGFQLWHSTDVRIYPMQKLRQASDDRAVLLAVWHLESDRVVTIGSDLQGSARIVEGWKYGIEQLDEPYPWGAMFGRRYYDFWKVDLENGQRALLLEKVRYSWTSSAGHWQLFFDGEHYWTANFDSGQLTNITNNLATVFADTTYDTPTDLLPPYGVGGWLEQDAAVLLYDQHDIWKVLPDGSGGERLTSGLADDIEYRIARLPDDDTPGIAPDKPLYLAVTGRHSKMEGFARVNPDSELETLIYAEERIRGLQKADSADVFIYRAEDHDDSPDFFATGPDLDRPQQRTHTNPFLGEFDWSRSELIDFVSESGRPLQAVLKYPVGYKKGDRVPTIVYTYEILSTMLHSFEVPSERDYYNFTAWTHNGYAVLLPDIVYRAREPGISALESVRAAVASVVEMGVADPDRIGLIGHSWGGYQAAFLPTRTNIFAASVAGAPLTDFVSFMGQIHWAAGMPELAHWETGQGRMEVPFWEDPEAHRRNSPIHKIQDLETPMLMVFGDNDGTVDFDQGTEFYNFARRAGKEMVLLVYEGERHGFSMKPNQIDYHRRILEWFGHYLKGEPAQSWITAGIPAKDQKEEGRRVAEKGSSAAQQ